MREQGSVVGDRGSGITDQGADHGLLITVYRSMITYIEVTKPLSVALLVFTAVGTMIVAAKGFGPTRGLSMGLFLRALVAITAACAGANAVTCYIDRDMDGVMARTKHRPLPMKRIDPPERALAWGLALFAFGLLLGWLINPLSALCLLLGFLDNVVVYNLLTKRRSPLNVIWGSFSGGLPALFGWTAVTNSVGLTPILIAALVVLWTPNHIWNLAIAHSEDYRKVQVPMLPAVYSLEKTIRCIVSTVLLMYVLSIMLGIVGPFGGVYLGTALLSGLAVCIGNIGLLLKPTRERAWTMFKLSSPYLFVLFLAMMVDVLVR